MKEGILAGVVLIMIEVVCIGVTLKKIEHNVSLIRQEVCQPGTYTNPLQAEPYQDIGPYEGGLE